MLPTVPPPAVPGCWQQLNKQQLCLQQPQQGTSVQGCQRASEMAAGSCQHLSLQTLALYLHFKHMSVPGKEAKLLIPHIKLWTHTTYRFTVNQIISDIFTLVLSKWLYRSFPKHESPTWELSWLKEHVSLSIHLACNRVFKSRACRFLWAFLLDYSEANT